MRIISSIAAFSHLEELSGHCIPVEAIARHPDGNERAFLEAIAAVTFDMPPGYEILTALDAPVPGSLERKDGKPVTVKGGFVRVYLVGPKPPPKIDGYGCLARLSWDAFFDSLPGGDMAKNDLPGTLRAVIGSGIHTAIGEWMKTAETLRAAARYEGDQVRVLQQLVRSG
ncbi:MAG: hypothetical protein WDN10_03820 [bacterium]